MDGHKNDEEMVHEHIKLMNDNKNRSESNTHRLNRVDMEIDDLKNTYSVLIKMESKIENVEEKLEDQRLESARNVKDIITALAGTKKTWKDKAEDVLVYIIVLSALYMVLKAMEGGII
ncbi:MAG: hypothetical protein PF505_03000 [Vallitaleaceae bacterium]|jgi:predicted  nucleic acid-binding Zn-ribbon protein|nr:hypothetical protein [Vallitaleaceae bacterium]